jgi:hypothetical protein
MSNMSQTSITTGVQHPIHPMRPTPPDGHHSHASPTGQLYYCTIDYVAPSYSLCVPIAGAVPLVVHLTISSSPEHSYSPHDMACFSSLLFHSVAIELSLFCSAGLDVYPLAPSQVPATLLISYTLVYHSPILTLTYVIQSPQWRLSYSLLSRFPFALRATHSFTDSTILSHTLVHCVLILILIHGYTILL